MGLRHINDYLSYVWVKDNQVSFNDGLSQVPAPSPQIGVPRLGHKALPEHCSLSEGTDGGITCCRELRGAQAGVLTPFLCILPSRCTSMSAISLRLRTSFSSVTIATICVLWWG